MENRKSIKLILLMAVFFIPLIKLQAYVPETTHRALTQEAIKVFNNYNPDKSFSDSDIKYIKIGSAEEDTYSAPRALRHFYDPINNKGIFNFETSKSWAQNTRNQALSSNVYSALDASTVQSYYGSDSDFSWEKAIYEYVHGSKDTGLQSLGHILHLIQDASVPDHTRLDPHPNNSPYESFANRYNENNITDSINSKLISPKEYSNLNDYFKNLAEFSNKNFFSGDTIRSKSYTLPLIIEEKDVLLNNGIPVRFGFNGDNLLTRIDISRDSATNKTVKSYSLNDPDNLVLSDYWKNLSVPAISYSAGIIELFFKAVEKERQSNELLAKNQKWMSDKAKALAVTANKNFAGPMAALNSVGLSNYSNSNTGSGNQPTNTNISQNNKQNIPVSNVKITVTNLPKNNQNSPQMFPVSPGFGGGNAVTNNNIQIAPPEISNQPEIDRIAPTFTITIPICNSTTTNFAFNIKDNCVVQNEIADIFFTLSTTTDDFAYYSIKSVNGNTTTTATTTSLSLLKNQINTFEISALDISNNESSPQIITIENSERPIVINEIAWAGTDANSRDEWMELYNTTNSEISLSDWTLYSADEKPYINLSGIIYPKSFYLLERKDDENVSNIKADILYGNDGANFSLGNTGETMILSRASTTIDYVPFDVENQNWFAGSNGGTSMERVSPYISSDEYNNWYDFDNRIKIIGTDINGGEIYGTPRARNSVNYFVNNSEDIDNKEIVLKKDCVGDCYYPYIFENGQRILNGGIVKVDSGIDLKLLGNIGIYGGHLYVNGKDSNKVTFSDASDQTFGEIILNNPSDSIYYNINVINLSNSNNNFSGADFIFAKGLDMSVSSSTLNFSNVNFNECDSDITIYNHSNLVGNNLDFKNCPLNVYMNSSIKLNNFRFEGVRDSDFWLNPLNIYRDSVGELNDGTFLNFYNDGGISVYSNSELKLNNVEMNNVFGNDILSVFNNGTLNGKKIKIRNTDDFDNCCGYSGISVFGNSNALLDDFEFIGDRNSNGISFFNNSTNTNKFSIKNGKISGFSAGILSFDNNSGIEIDNVELSDNDYGIEYYGGGIVHNLLKIINNTYYGVYNSTGNLLSLENIWWGDESGPYSELNNNEGLGNEAYGSVDFIPWIGMKEILEPEKAEISVSDFSIVDEDNSQNILNESKDDEDTVSDGDISTTTEDTVLNESIVVE